MDNDINLLNNMVFFMLESRKFCNRRILLSNSDTFLFSFFLYMYIYCLIEPRHVISNNVAF